MDKMNIFIVRKDSPAFELLKRGFLKSPLKPGQVIPASEDEIDSWRKDIEIVELCVIKGE